MIAAARIATPARMSGANSGPTSSVSADVCRDEEEDHADQRKKRDDRDGRRVALQPLDQGIDLDAEERGQRAEKRHGA